LREWSSPGALGLEVADDTLFVRAGGEIVQYTLDGQERSRVGERARGTGSGLEPAGGITYDGNSIYVADALNQSIKSYARDGSLLWVTPQDVTESAVTSETTAVAEPVVGDDASELIDLPQDVTIDANGRLIAVDAFSFKILVLDPGTGAIESSYGSDGSADGLFVYPTSIAYDEARDWFVIADTANDRLQIVRLEGSGGGAGQAAARALSSPFRVCAIPLLALFVALAVIVLTGRRRNDSEGSGTGGIDGNQV